MRAEKITLRNFRSYEERTFEFSDGVNAVCGANAAGKTNLLEAIYYFAAGKSFRAPLSSDLVRTGTQKAEITLEYSNVYGTSNIGAEIRKSGKKTFNKNGVPLLLMSEFLGRFRVVLFTPEHLNIAKGAPEHRRKLIDYALCQLQPRFVATLNEYNKWRMQKNSLLKPSFDDSGKEELLGIINERMASLGAVITVQRYKYLSELQKRANEIQKTMSGGREDLELIFKSQVTVEEMTVEQVRNGYAELFERRARVEREQHTAMFGPHKEDFGININGAPIRSYGSQGQQRTAVLSIKLAEGVLSYNVTGEYPVYLFDDVLSELDADRRKAMLGRIPDKQIIITACDDNLPIKNIARMIRI